LVRKGELGGVIIEVNVRPASGIRNELSGQMHDDCPIQGWDVDRLHVSSPKRCPKNLFDGSSLDTIGASSCGIARSPDGRAVPEGSGRKSLLLRSPRVVKDHRREGADRRVPTPTATRTCCRPASVLASAP